MAVSNLNIDNLFFQKLKNNPATNFINAEDLDKQFLFVSTYINTVLTPAINKLVNGEIVDDGSENPLNKFVFNNKDGVVEFARIDSNLIPDGYLTPKTFESGIGGSVLVANSEGEFDVIFPNNANFILTTNASGVTWNDAISNKHAEAGFKGNDKLRGDKFVRRTLSLEHIRPGTLTPNIPDQIARTRKITNGAVTRGKIAAGSLELGNFAISASFPFLRLYGLMTPDHFNDGAITSSIIQNNSIDLKNFINYRWTDYEINNLGYTIFNKYPELSRPEGSDWFFTNTSVFSNPNTFYFYYYSNYYTIGIPTLNPRSPVNFYFPRKAINTESSDNNNTGSYWAFCTEPESTPTELVTFKYKYVTMGKLVNNTVKSQNFTLGDYVHNPRPVGVVLKFFNIPLSKTLGDSMGKTVRSDSGSGGVFHWADCDGRNMLNLEEYVSKKYGHSGIRRGIPYINEPYAFFTAMVTDLPSRLIDNPYWFGGHLLRNYSQYKGSDMNPDVLRLKNIHIKPGTIGKRHFTPSELQIMKAAADAKFNG